jgi:hypothetical protein
MDTPVMAVKTSATAVEPTIMTLTNVKLAIIDAWRDHKPQKTPLQNRTENHFSRFGL